MSVIGPCFEIQEHAIRKVLLIFFGNNNMNVYSWILSIGILSNVVLATEQTLPLESLKAKFFEIMGQEDMSRSGEITLFLGSMESGKTNALQMVHYNLQKLGKKILCMTFQPCLQEAGSRTGKREEMQWQSFDPQTSLIEEVKKADLQKKDALILDEGQFMTEAQIQELDTITRMGIHVYVAALRFNFFGEPWPVLTNLKDKAHHISELFSSCALCAAPATHNLNLLLLDPNVQKNGLSLQSIGKDHYIIICQHCFDKFKQLYPQYFNSFIGDPL